MISDGAAVFVVEQDQGCGDDVADSPWAEADLTVRAYGGRHQRLTRRGGWDTQPGLLPIVEGTLIQVIVDRLPGDRAPKPLWAVALAP